MSRAVALLCLAGCDAVFLEKSPIEDCPLDYVSVAGQPTRYRIVTMGKTWSVAQADCADDSDGLTHLAVIDRVMEIDAIHTLSPPNEILWVGYARDLAADPFDGFEDVFGEPLPRTSSLWNNNEPNGKDGPEPVVQIVQNGLNDDNLTTEKRYVCECDGKRATRTFSFP